MVSQEQTYLSNIAYLSINKYIHIYTYTELMNHSELKFQYVHISNWTLWLTAISLMSQVPAPSYGVALAQFKALILWTFTGRFAGRLCIRNPKSKGIVWIWPQGMKFVELAISYMVWANGGQNSSSKWVSKRNKKYHVYLWITPWKIDILNPKWWRWMVNWWFSWNQLSDENGSIRYLKAQTLVTFWM